jgi:hypothetical protein
MSGQTVTMAEGGRLTVRRLRHKNDSLLLHLLHFSLSLFVSPRPQFVDKLRAKNVIIEMKFSAFKSTATFRLAKLELAFHKNNFTLLFVSFLRLFVGN